MSILEISEFWRLATLATCLGASLAAVGCDDATSPGAEFLPTTDAQVGDGAAPAPFFRLDILSDVQAGALGPIAPLHLEGVEQDSGERFSRLLSADGQQLPLSVELPELADGRWALRVFQDRDGDGRWTGCPFPPRPEHVQAADSWDNIFGEVDARVFRGGAAEVRLDRRICGPGQPETGVRGTIQTVDGGLLDGAPIYMRVESLDVQPDLNLGDGERAPNQAGLTVPLLPGGLDATGAFAVGELLPGAHRLTFFVDGDGDLTPSPCTEQGLGGADRFVQVLESVQIVAGQRVALEPIVLAPRVCPEVLTGISGSLRLSADLEAAAAQDPEAVAPWGVLDGTIRVGLFDDLGLRASTRIAASIRARTQPIPFTVTGVSPGRWRVVAWLDRDEDQRFSPCNALSGAEVVWASLVDVEIGEDVTPLGELELRASGCPPLSGVYGTLTAQWEQGSAGSGRPVRVDLVGLDEGGERRSLPLFENHRELPVPDVGGQAPFAITGELNPGRYEATFYLDTDRDGVFESCRETPYGDRAAAQPIEIEVVDGQMLPVGDETTIELSTLDCLEQFTSIRPIVRLDELSERQRAASGALRMQLTERGGWGIDSQMVLLFSGIEGDVFESAQVRVAPGEYNVTVYADTSGDERFGACGDSAEDRVLARVDLVVDAIEPNPEPLLVLEASCGH